MILALSLLKQIAIMFILMNIGYCLFKSKKITLQGNKELGTFLIYVILPASIIKSYITDFSKEKLIGLLISFIAAILSLAISIIVSRIIFGSKYKIEHFGTAFSNAGFIGIPLVKASVGDQYIFYVASFVALLNILQWTYGVMVMSGNKEAITLKKIVTNPIIISMALGLLLFFTQLPVPFLLTDTLSLIGNMTAPVAMITLGVYLAQLKFKDLFAEKWAYMSTLFRLIIIPILTLAVLTMLPERYRDIKLTILIVAAAPVGSNVAIFAQMIGLDYARSVKSVCLSTIFSIITMPFIIGIANILWK